MKQMQQEDIEKLVNENLVLNQLIDELQEKKVRQGADSPLVSIYLADINSLKLQLESYREELNAKNLEYNALKSMMEANPPKKPMSVELHTDQLAFMEQQNAVLKEQVQDLELKIQQHKEQSTKLQLENARLQS